MVLLTMDVNLTDFFLVYINVYIYCSIKFTETYALKLHAKVNDKELSIYSCKTQIL
jgi:hypothetical protein